jgi:hypothetical protein
LQERRRVSRLGRIAAVANELIWAQFFFFRCYIFLDFSIMYFYNRSKKSKIISEKNQLCLFFSVKLCVSNLGMGLLSSVIAMLSWFYLNYAFLFSSYESTGNSSNKQKIIVMSYNVWFLEDLE